MTEPTRNRLEAIAVLALLMISLTAIIGGLIIAFYSREVEGVVAIVAGAVGGIVAIARGKSSI